MKKLFLLVVLAAGIILGTEAQNRSINFEQNNNWKQILKKAKKEKKLVFVDCYTSWCGPCKMLAKNVFTQDSVADLFNGAFVNAKFDMEKDADGVILKKQFAIQAFPTLVFVDPATQQVVHRMVGAGDAPWLMGEGRKALDPQNNLSGLQKRYEAGERNPEFLGKYLKALSSAYMKKEQGMVASEYLNTLTEDQLATKENWSLIWSYVSDPLAPSLRKVMANRGKFYTVISKETVDFKLENTIAQAALDMAAWRASAPKPFDEARNQELVSYLQQTDCAAAPAALAELYTAACVRKGDFRGMLDNMKEAFYYNLFRDGSGNSYFQRNIESLTGCDDPALVKEGISWIDERCNGTADNFRKAELMNSKARLLTKLGDKDGADQAKMLEEKYTKEGEKQSGGRVIRAMRMN